MKSIVLFDFLYCSFYSDPLKTQGILPLPWLSISPISHYNFLSLNISCMWGSHAYIDVKFGVFALGNHSHVVLIIRLASRILGIKEFLPPRNGREHYILFSSVTESVFIRRLTQHINRGNAVSLAMSL